MTYSSSELVNDSSDKYVLKICKNSNFGIIAASGDHANLQATSNSSTIIGVAVGVVVFLAIAMGVGYFIYSRKNGSKGKKIKETAV